MTDLGQILKTLRKQGWRVEISRRRCHVRLYPPGGGDYIVTGSTPRGGKRSIENLRSQLRKAGAVLKGR